MISCIIPAYNEEETIQKSIKIVKKLPVDEIIVVDDGSIDQTCLRARETGVIALKHKKNKGKGAAIKTGLKEAKGTIIFFFDADIIQIDLKKLEKLIKLVDSAKYDVSIGYFDSQYFQTFTNVLYKPLMCLFFPEVMNKINKGYLSGQRVFKRNVLEKIDLRDGFDLEASMNIELTFIEPEVKIGFINLGKIKLKPKGYQKSMEIIIETIINYAKKYKRLERIKESSFDKVVDLLQKTTKEVIESES